MADGCTFCEIAAGRIAAPVVFEDETSLAFLDHKPLFPGHMLLIPRMHFETLADLPAPALGPLFANAQWLCRAAEHALPADGSFVAVNNRVSQSVPHLHVHVVPRRRKDGLKGFFWPRTRYRDAAEMENVRALLAETVHRLKRSSQ